MIKYFGSIHDKWSRGRRKGIKQQQYIPGCCVTLPWPWGASPRRGTCPGLHGTPQGLPRAGPGGCTPDPAAGMCWYCPAASVHSATWWQWYTTKYSEMNYLSLQPRVLKYLDSNACKAGLWKVLLWNLRMIRKLERSLKIHTVVMETRFSYAMRILINSRWFPQKVGVLWQIFKIFLFIYFI